MALQQGHDRVVAVLLENDSRSRVRLPALHIAAKKDDVQAATLLLQTDSSAADTPTVKVIISISSYRRQNCCQSIILCSTRHDACSHWDVRFVRHSRGALRADNYTVDVTMSGM